MESIVRGVSAGDPTRGWEVKGLGGRSWALHVGCPVPVLWGFEIEVCSVLQQKEISLPGPEERSPVPRTGCGSRCVARFGCC